MEQKHNFYGKRYKSGVPLVDWVFRRFICIINRRIKLILIKRRLKDENGELLDGQWDPTTGVLELNPAKWGHTETKPEDYDVLQAFIHELSHILHNSTPEHLFGSSVNHLEKILWESFTPAQKLALRSFLPKYD